MRVADHEIAVTHRLRVAVIRVRVAIQQVRIAQRVTEEQSHLLADTLVYTIDSLIAVI